MSSTMSSSQLTAASAASTGLEKGKSASGVQGTTTSKESVKTSSSVNNKLNIPNIKPQDIGVKILVEPKDKDDIEVDFVAVHGIGVHPATAWVHKESGVNWLTHETMLPAVFPKARILAFGYDSVWFGDNPVRQSVDTVANHLLRELVEKRGECQGRPIIFIVHCFGGIVVQSAYTLARLQTDDFPDIYNSITGMVFLGTPHAGSNALQTSGEIFKAVVEANLRVEGNVLQYLGQDNDMLVSTVHNFTREIHSRQKPPILFCFYEQRATNVGELAGMTTKQQFAVNVSSGTLNGHPHGGLPLDHFGMNKFENTDDNNYQSVCNQIKKMRDGSSDIMKERRLGKTPSSTSQQHIPSQTLPFKHEPNFVPRNGILDQIEEKFEKDGVVVLCGGPGIGKTHIAIEYAYMFDREHPNSKVHWVSAGNAEQFELSYKLIAESLSLRDMANSTLESVRNRLKQDAGGHWLMILDGLENVEALKATNPALKGKSLWDFVPKCHNGWVLVTTRSMSTANRIIKQKQQLVIEVPGLDDNGACQLLLGSTEKDTAKLKSATGVAQALEYSPVAITLAYTYLHTSSGKGMSPGQYRKIIELETSGPTKPTSGISRAWRPLFQIIKRKYPEAAELLLLIGILDLQTIRTGFLAEATDRTVEKQIKLLVRYGMVEPFINRTAISVTATIRQCILEWLDENDRRSIYEEKALSLMRATYPEPEENDFDKCENFYPCALAISNFRPSEIQGKRDRAGLLLKVARYNFHLRQYQAALRRLEDCISLQNEDPEATEASINTIRKIIEQVQEAQARPAEGEHGNGELIKASKQYDLAFEHDAQGRYAQAAESYVRAYQTSEHRGAPGRSESFQILERLVRIYCMEQQWNQAWTVLQVLSAGQESTLGHDHPETLTTRQNAALVLQELDYLDAAEAELRQVLKAQFKLLGGNNPATLRTACSLALCWRRQGKVQDSQKLYEATLRSQENTFGKTSQDAQVTRTMLQELLQQNGKME